MKKRLFREFRTGARKVGSPRPVGSIVKGMLRSKSPLAKGYRKHMAAKRTGGAL